MNILAAVLLCFAALLASESANATAIKMKMTLTVDEVTQWGHPNEPFDSEFVEVGDRFYTTFFLDDEFLGSDGFFAVPELRHIRTKMLGVLYDQDRPRSDQGGSEFEGYGRGCSFYGDFTLPGCDGPNVPWGPTVFRMEGGKVTGVWGGIIAMSDDAPIDWLGDRFSAIPMRDISSDPDVRDDAPSPSERWIDSFGVSISGPLVVRQLPEPGVLVSMSLAFACLLAARHCGRARR